MGNNNLVISIGRQFGAGGRVVGKAIAESLGIEYFDNDLITLAAKSYGFDPELFRKADERTSKSHLLQRLEEYISGGCWTDNWLSQDSLFKIQSDVIRRIAEEKPCVIVGRCSDYVLRDNPNCISIFLHSSDKDRVERIRKRMGADCEDSFETMVEKFHIADKKRANYYNFYTSKVWGMSSSYTLSVDVSILGDEGTVAYLLAFISEFKKKKNIL